MDPVTWLAAALAGVAVGLFTGLLPGWHVNTLAALALAVATPHPVVAVALVAVATTHAFVQVLPGTYLGAPSGDDALGALPAHRMLSRGLGREAVRVALDAALGGLVFGIIAGPLLAYVLTMPAVQHALALAAVPVVAATLAILLWLEARKGWRAVRWAAGILLLSGTLGLVARTTSLQALLPVPASPFLPLLSGLFGVAGLLASLGRAPVPDQHTPQRPGQLRGVRIATGLGLASSVLTLAVPGLTSASAAAWASLGRRDNDAGQVALLSAINTAHLALAVTVLVATGAARTGLAQAVGASTGLASSRLAGTAATAAILAAALLAGLVAWRGTRLLDRAYLRAVHRWHPDIASTVAVVLLVLTCLLLSGWTGMLLLAAATAVGLLPMAVGVRRIHLTGALLLPALLGRWI